MKTEFEKSAAARMLDADPRQGRRCGICYRSKRYEGRKRTCGTWSGANPAAEAGLRKAMADHMVAEAELNSKEPRKHRDRKHGQVRQADEEIRSGPRCLSTLANPSN